MILASRFIGASRKFDNCELFQLLRDTNQEHLATFYSSLSATQRKALIDDIREAQLESLVKSFQKAQHQTNSAELQDRYAFQPPTPLHWTSATECPTQPEQKGHASRCFLTRMSETPGSVLDGWREKGLELIAAGKVAGLVMAGGQGTRLGWEGPKGTYPIGAISGKSLFQLICEKHLAVLRMATERGNLGTGVPTLLVMTSDENHDATVAFFKESRYFGLGEKNVFFFQQATVPSFSKDGKILLQSKYALARNPDGNGGLFVALKRSGLMDMLRARGIIGIHVFGVDNALAKVLDPVLIGYTEALSADIGNKCAEKVAPNERVGVLCLRSSKKKTDHDAHDRYPVDDLDDTDPCIVEYTELPEAMSTATTASGDKLLFSAANICNHYFKLSFVEKILENLHHPALQTVHLAQKKIPYLDWTTDTIITPDSANGIKLEHYIFDCFPLAEKVVGLEGLRDEEFAPVKDAEGDASPESCRQAMTEMYKSWISRTGKVFLGAGALEISPLVSYDGNYLGARVHTKSIPSRNLKSFLDAKPYFLLPAYISDYSDAFENQAY